jgi:hypothetical protein
MSRPIPLWRSIRSEALPSEGGVIDSRKRGQSTLAWSGRPTFVVVEDAAFRSQPDVNRLLLTCARNSRFGGHIMIRSQLTTDESQKARLSCPNIALQINRRALAKRERGRSRFPLREPIGRHLRARGRSHTSDCPALR